MISHTQQTTIYDLRKAGHSYSYIQERTGISKSTLSYWLTDVPYTPNKETVARIGLARARSGEAKSKIKRASIHAAQKEATHDIATITQRDLFMLGLGLYIGEGTKTHGTVRIMNSNPKVLTLALAWFKHACGLTIENFTVRLHLYPDNGARKCILYWSRELGIPTTTFQKTHIDTRMNKATAKHGKLPYGIAHITVRARGDKRHGVFLSRKIAAWADEAIKQAGIV